MAGAVLEGVAEIGSALGGKILAHHIADQVVRPPEPLTMEHAINTFPAENPALSNAHPIGGTLPDTPQTNGTVEKAIGPNNIPNRALNPDGDDGTWRMASSRINSTITHNPDDSVNNAQQALGHQDESGSHRNTLSSHYDPDLHELKNHTRETMTDYHSREAKCITEFAGKKRCKKMIHSSYPVLDHRTKPLIHKVNVTRSEALRHHSEHISDEQQYSLHSFIHGRMQRRGGHVGKRRLPDGRVDSAIPMSIGDRVAHADISHGAGIYPKPFGVSPETAKGLPFAYSHQYRYRF